MNLSLKSLLAFEATVRLGSMSAAARALGISQPAVSQRIRQIEEATGAILFDRTGRTPRLSAEGRTYHDEIASALQRITGATSRLRARASAHDRVLVVAVNFGFAHLWLLPRLSRLQGAFPGIAFEIVPVDRDDAREMSTADLTVRFDRCHDDSDGWLLFPEAVFPVCSPQFAQAHGLAGTLRSEQTAATPLLHMDERDRRWLDWARWCVLAGCDAPASPGRFHYNNYPLLLNAAIEGHGLALGWRALVDESLAEGTLVALEPAVQRPGYGYILQARHADRAVPAALIEWFLRESDVPIGATLVQQNTTHGRS